MGTFVKILVAGIGNIFLGDDAFGSEVARRLMERNWPEGVKVVDFGIRGLDLVYALLDGCETAILIDAAPRGEEPAGTLYVLEPEMAEMNGSAAMVEAHSMDPMKVLRTAVAMGARPGRVLIVGCQPGAMPGDVDGETPMEMCPEVASAVEEAVRMVEELVKRFSGQSVCQEATQ